MKTIMSMSISLPARQERRGQILDSWAQKLSGGVVVVFQPKGSGSKGSFPLLKKKPRENNPLFWDIADILHQDVLDHFFGGGGGGGVEQCVFYKKCYLGKVLAFRPSPRVQHHKDQHHIGVCEYMNVCVSLVLCCTVSVCMCENEDMCVCVQMCACLYVVWSVLPIECPASCLF